VQAAVNYHFSKVLVVSEGMGIVVQNYFPSSEIRTLRTRDTKYSEKGSQIEYFLRIQVSGKLMVFEAELIFARNVFPYFGISC
jgi:hypothetical protein